MEFGLDLREKKGGRRRRRSEEEGENEEWERVMRGWQSLKELVLI